MGVTSEALQRQQRRVVASLAAAYFCVVAWNSFASDQPASNSVVDSARLMIVAMWAWR